MTNPTDPPSAETPAPPTAVFALNRLLSTEKLEAEFAGTGIRPVTAKSPEQFLMEVKKAGVFAVFVDIEFDKALTAMLPRLVPDSPAKWLLLSPPLPLALAKPFYDFGIEEILPHPAQPAVLKQRAQILLARRLNESPLGGRIIKVQGGAAPKATTATSASVGLDPDVKRTPEELVFASLELQASREPATGGEKLPSAAVLRDVLVSLRAYAVKIESRASPAVAHIRVPTAATVAEVQKLGFERCRDDLAQLLRDCRDHLVADRIFIVSMAPDNEGSRYYVVQATGEGPQEGSRLPEWLLPELAIADERRCALLITPEVYSSGPWTDGLKTAWEKRVSPLSPRALVVLPLYPAAGPGADARAPVVKLVIVFGQHFESTELAAIEGILNLLSMPYLHIAHVDFLSRVYRGLRR